MKLEQIIEMAKQVGMTKLPGKWDGWSCHLDELQAFAQLVRNAALEEAAIKSWSCGMDWHLKRNNTDVREVGSAIASEIRGLKS